MYYSYCDESFLYFLSSFIVLGESNPWDFQSLLVHVSNKGSLNEGLKCGCFGHANIVESLGPPVQVVLTYTSRERGEELVG